MQQPHYTRVAQILHWLIAGLIVSQYVLAKLAERAEEQANLAAQLAILANHKSIGITVLGLVLLRLIWRVTHRPPALPSTMPAWQLRISHLMHWALYALIIALPISGWLMSSAKSYSVSWFNYLLLPDFVEPNKSLAKQLQTLHDLFAEILFVLALLHILAAFKHLLFDKDGVMQRMASKAGLAILLVSIIAAVSQLGFPQRKAIDDKETPTTTLISSEKVNAEPQTKELSTARASDLPYWQIDYAKSHIKFTGDQAGAPFTGEWQRWQAEIQFEHDDLDASRFDVLIDIASVETGDDERDQTIVGDDFFAQERFAQARFLAEQFTAQDKGFAALANLTMKGITKPTEFTFTVNEEAGQLILTGVAKLDRLAWNIGAGDWTDTSWVGQTVTVDVKVVASKQ